MAKGKNKVEGTVGIENSAPVAPVHTFETMTREELKARYQDNVARRQELANENKVLIQFYKSALSSEKVEIANARIAALQAKLDALTNPPAAEIPVSEETPAELAM